MNDLQLREPHLPARTSELTHLGQAADQVAASHVFQNFRARKASNTIARHNNDLALFAACLREAGAVVGDLSTDPAAWAGVTWGLVAAFQQWQLHRGYAVSSVNVRISTVKTYARLALKASVLSAQEYALIRAVDGYSRTEGKRLDAQRPVRRVGAKKAAAVMLTDAQIARLKLYPNTAQGRRDTVLMCLLLDHGLRCGEVVLLTVEDLQLDTGQLRFYRPKVDKTQTHDLSLDTRLALKQYLAAGGPSSGPLLQTTRKGGAITGQGMSERAITGRVAYLGKQLGIEGLSAHDCRHMWATRAARAGTALDRLMEAGGWASMAMPLRYIEAARIANEGVYLGSE